jgi:hypothetical protein
MAVRGSGFAHMIISVGAPAQEESQQAYNWIVDMVTRDPQWGVFTPTCSVVNCPAMESFNADCVLFTFEHYSEL